MKCHSDNFPLSIEWKYERDETNQVIFTTCQIYLDVSHVDNEILAESKVKRHPKQQHCKDMARKASLAKAMAAMGLTKKERTEIWKTYLNRRQPQVTHQQTVVA